MRQLLVLVVALLSAMPAQARESLGVFDKWGAFRDPQPLRCYAIAQPFRAGRGEAQPYATISYWPKEGVRGQVHVRLSREIRPESKVILSIDGRRITLLAARANAWSANGRADASIIAAMRSGRVMSIAGIGANGGGFADSYYLKGAATAIDAAALGCARAR